MPLDAYLELLDWTARQIVPGKHGFTPQDTPPHFRSPDDRTSSMVQSGKSIWEAILSGGGTPALATQRVVFEKGDWLPGAP